MSRRIRLVELILLTREFAGVTWRKGQSSVVLCGLSRKSVWLVEVILMFIFIVCRYVLKLARILASLAFPKSFVKKRRRIC